MSDRIVEWLDSLDLPPCDCGEDEDALCPACARMIAVDRLRAQSPTWPAVRRGIVSDLTAELERSKTARDLWAALFPDMVTDPERARRESRVTALEWAVEAAGAWHPGVRRG